MSTTIELKTAGETTAIEKMECFQSPVTRTKRRTTLGLLCITGFWGGAAFSVMSPFLPQEAKMKGLSNIHTGIIFSCYQLGFFVLSPFFGNYLTRLGSKRILVIGVFVVGLFTILFGFTKVFPSGKPFFMAAISCRILDAAGGAGAMTALFAIAADVYPDHMSLAFGLIQTSISVGRMIAPAIGGVLYEAGGYWLPFIVLGWLTMLHACILVVFLSPIHDVQRDRKTNIFSLLHSTLIWIINICIFNSAIGAIFISPTFSLYLKQFDLSPTLIGIVFAIMPLTYGISAPLWGIISDKLNLHVFLIVLGNFMAAGAILFIGPSPVLQFLPSTISVIVVGLVALGIFNNCCLIPTRKCLFIGALDMGFEENIDTHGIVSGMFNTVYCLGAFVGPILSGILVDELGFRQSTTVLSCFFFMSALVSGTYFLLHFLKSRYRMMLSCNGSYERLN